MATRLLTHSRITLVLHQLASGSGRPLLLLHGLGERSPQAVPSLLGMWPGSVFALDFTGHGGSSIPSGGGYTAEILMADVDSALAELGPATVLGRGLGAYVALLIAGGRPTLMRGAILCDGTGLAGGGTFPLTPMAIPFGEPATTTPDPQAVYELSRDVRPPDYAAQYVRMTMQHSELDTPITVCARNRPPWLAAVVAEAGVVEATIDQAIRAYGALR